MFTEKHTQIVKEITDMCEIVESGFYVDRFVLESDNCMFLLFEDKLEGFNFDSIRLIEGETEEDNHLDVDPSDVLVWDIEKKIWKDCND